MALPPRSAGTVVMGKGFFDLGLFSTEGTLERRDRTSAPAMEAYIYFGTEGVPDKGRTLEASGTTKRRRGSLVWGAS